MKRFTDPLLAFAVISASLAVAAAGCTTGQPRAARIDSSYERPDDTGRTIYMEPVQSSARTVISKNYSVGSRRVASVGEPMVGVRDYTSSDLVVAAVATREFVQYCRTPEDLTPEEIAAAEASAAAVAAAANPVDPRATAEVPSGGFEHDPAAYSGANGAAAAVPAEVEAAQATPVAIVRTPEPEGERDLAEPLRPRSGGRIPDDQLPPPPPVVDAEGVPVEPFDPLACHSGRLAFARGEQGERFPVAGTFEEAGKRYYLLDVPTPSGNLYIASDALGRLKAAPYLAWRDLDEVATTRFGVPLRYVKVPIELEEDGRLFRYETDETIALQGGDYRNFELVYEGTTYDHRGMVYHVLYKEYGRDRPKTPIYVQDLAYASQTNTVDILGMRIRIHDVNDDRIIYTVQRD